MKRKVVLKVNELQEMDVSFISLVKNAANRAPFKILKSAEGKTLDLKKLFSLKKEESDEAPELVAIITKADCSEAISTILKGEGVALVDTVDMADGLVMLPLKDGVDVENSVVLKMSDDIAAVVAGIEKSFYNWPDSGDFSTNIQKAGFYPGVRVATDVLMDTLYNALETVEKGESPTEAVTDILKQFTDYVTSLATEIPTSAFKLEKMEVTEASTEDADADADADSDDTADVDADADADADAEDVDGTADADAEDTDADADADAVEKTEVDVGAEIQKAVGKILGDALAQFGKDMDGKLTTMGEAITALEKSATETAETLQNTVAAHADNDADDGDDTETVEKTEGVYDSALSFPGIDD